MDCESFTLFSPPCTWKANEELTLLEAVELYSYGNWGDISLFIPNKTTEEIKQHFIDYYINGNIGQATWDMVKNKGNVIEDHSCNNNCPLSPSLTSPLLPIPELTSQQKQQLGYMPKRDDFEREYDNEVESLVATLSMNVKDEDDLDRDMKLAYIDIYNRRLAERCRRKDIVRRYGLVDLFYKTSAHEIDLDTNTNSKDSKVTSKQDSCQTSISQNKNNLPKRKVLTSPSMKVNSEENNKLDNNLKIYSQYLTRAQLDELIENLKREKELKIRIKELIRYRKNGLTKISEISAYEIARAWRDKKKENKKKLQGNGENIGSGRKSTHVTKSLEKEIEIKNLSNKNTQKILPINRQEIISKDSKAFNLDLSDRKGEKEGLRANTADPNCDLNSSHSLNPGISQRGKFDVSLMPGAKLLSNRERKLCNSIKLRPTQYITLKTMILKEHIRKMHKGYSKSTLENIDKNVRQKVANFIVKSGWVYGS